MIKRAAFEARWLPLWLVAPQMLIVFVFFYWPAAQALWWSFTIEPPFGGPAEFVGLANLRAIASSPEYWRVVWITLAFSAATTGLALFLGLILAIFADRGLRGLVAYKTVLMWPYAVAAPAAAVVFKFIFEPNVGMVVPINQAFPGIWNPLLDGRDAFLMVVLVAAWKSITFNFVFFLAGLQAMPKSLVEAAALDGAGPVRRFFDIVFPLLTPTLFFLVVLNVVESFTEGFGIVNVMTAGGPGGATTTMVYKVYSDGFQGLDYSGSSAQSLIIMMMVIGLTFVQFRFVERKVAYADQ